MKIDKTHWIVQFSTLVFVTFLFIFPPEVLDLENVFSSNTLSHFSLIPSLLSVFLVFLAMFLKRKPKIFTKEWLFNDFTYWNIFAFTLSIIALYHLFSNNIVYGIFTQIFAYISLFLGYANELRNGIVKEKKGKKK